MWMSITSTGTRQASPPEEVAGIMGKLIQKGKIRGWGQSMTTAKEIQRAYAVMPLCSEQYEYYKME